MLLFPPGVWLMILLAILVAAMLKYTRLAVISSPVGSNERTARLCGIHINRVKLLCIHQCSFRRGCRSHAILAVNGRRSNRGRCLELDVIAAVVIGGEACPVVKVPSWEV